MIFLSSTAKVTVLGFAFLQVLTGTAFAASTFYRAINVNGPALSIDGHAFTSSSTGGLTLSNAQKFQNQNVALSPSTDSNRATMIRSSAYGTALKAVVRVPIGTYELYLYNWEDNSAETFNLNVNGTRVVSNFSSGSAGAWRKIGPIPVNASAGTITLQSSGGDFNLSGLEIYKVSGTVSTPTPTPAPTATPQPTATPTPAPTATPAPVSGGPSISGVTLINSDTDMPQPLSGIAGQSAVISDNSSFDLTRVGQALNIRADVSSAGSVLFDLDGGSISHVENVIPYALASDTNGDYNSWTPSTGSHTLKVTAYSGSDLSGTAGPTYTVHFNVTVLSSGTPTPTPVPTATPIATATPAPTSTPVSGGGASTAEPSSYSTPIVISRGGTYSGNWRSTSVDGYAVKVATSEPVIIENSHLAGPGTLIDAVGASSNITVRNSSFHGYTPNVDNRSRGRAIDMTTFKNAVIENNFFENTGEVIELNSYVGNQTTETVKVRYNRVKNINMKYRNSNGAVYGNFVSVGAFMQGNPVNGEIGWNEVINEPGKSVSEDLINFSFAGGKSSSWFTIHDNYLKGSYHGDVFDPAGSAGGIQIDGEDNTRCAYIEAYGNSIAQIMNGGMGAAAGRHIYMHDNRVISSGKDASGRWFPASYAAAWGFAAYKTDPNPMTDIRIENNVFGWGAQGYQSQISGDADRQDYDATGNMFGSMKNNTEYKPGSTITEADQDNEYQLFRQKVQAAGLHIGP